MTAQLFGGLDLLGGLGELDDDEWDDDLDLDGETIEAAWRTIRDGGIGEPPRD